MIFEYVNYRKFLNSYIKSLPKRGRGFRVRIAEHLDCKTSFVSQVLNGDQNLSVEQAFLMISLLSLTAVEGRYFLSLVQAERAGRKDLQEHFRAEAENLRADFLRLKNRLGEKSISSKEDEFKYFSSSEYAYTHILTTIPEYQSREALLKKLNVSPNRLESILNYLIQLGYVTYNKGKYQPGQRRLHLADDAEIISTHHTNWRIQAIKSCQSPEPKDLHYSSVVSISAEDFDRIRAVMIQHIEEYRQIINSSPCEKPFSLCFDFFELK